MLPQVGGKARKTNKDYTGGQVCGIQLLRFLTRGSACMCCRGLLLVDLLAVALPRPPRLAAATLAGLSLRRIPQSISNPVGRGLCTISRAVRPHPALLFIWLPSRCFCLGPLSFSRSSSLLSLSACSPPTFLRLSPANLPSRAATTARGNGGRDDRGEGPAVRLRGRDPSGLGARSPLTRLSLCCTPPLPLVGFSIGMERGYQHNDSRQGPVRDLPPSNCCWHPPRAGGRKAPRRRDRGHEHGRSAWPLTRLSFC